VVAEAVAREFRALGSSCRIVVEAGAEPVADAARELIGSLERRWSRFLPDSEVSALNRAAGKVTMLSPDTYHLISLAVQATEATGGLFNPLMLHQLEAHGYDRPWGEGHPSPSGRPVGPAIAEPIVLYPEITAVRLPEGCGFDPGGIGKGLAVDLAVELCRDGGSAFASVELGGDLRVYGQPWYGEEWVIGVDDPFNPGRRIATFTPTSGAVTTSTTMKRRWTVGDRTYHHLLDPRTGQPSRSDIVAATTCADLAWWAEVASKTALLVGSAGASDHLRALGTPGAVVTDTGQILTTTEASTTKETTAA
jgi:FAD:protein FMN transferase